MKLESRLNFGLEIAYLIACSRLPFNKLLRPIFRTPNSACDPNQMRQALCLWITLVIVLILHFSYLQPQQNCLSDKISALTKHPNAKSTKKLALVGVLTTAAKFNRRSLIRTTYKNLLPSNLDFYFVIGQPSDEESRNLLELESRAHNDIIILPVTENMDEGKTFAYFTTIYQTGNEYAYVVKTDDDVFVHLPNLARRLLPLPKTGG